MKTITQPSTNSKLEKFIFSLTMILSTMLLSVKTFAQSAPEKVEVDINAGGDSVWYGQPWVWVVGIAVFIVIIVAITRNNNSTKA
ncbi:hypothetical protein [Daejeonella sp.]|uniref:hypothetical protein n=1 Tax=Daejeonella sp. TaxID=2805397 RepID=UPI003983042B